MLYKFVFTNAARLFTLMKERNQSSWGALCERKRFLRL